MHELSRFLPSTKLPAAIAVLAGVLTAGAALAQVQPDVARRVVESITRNGLIAQSPDCVLFVPMNETASYLDLEVRERHGGRCGGDPATSPRLFTLRYDKASGIVLRQSIDPGVGYVPLR